MIKKGLFLIQNDHFHQKTEQVEIRRSAHQDCIPYECLDARNHLLGNIGALFDRLVRSYLDFRW